MNGSALLGASSICNAVSWNGMYWLGSIESGYDGLTQVYSNDGISWFASNAGNTFSRPMALMSAKSGSEGRALELEGRALELERTQFGVGQTFQSIVILKNVTYVNNTNKAMTFYINIATDNGNNITLFINNNHVGLLNYAGRGTSTLIILPGDNFVFSVTGGVPTIYSAFAYF